MSLSLDIRHRFPGFALDVALDTPGPGVLALFGPSGSGKTTTVNAVAGLIRPDEGRVSVNGETLFDSHARVWVPPRRRRVGYVFQEARLFPHLTVHDNLLYGWRRAGRPFDRAGIDHVVALLGLGALLDRRPRTLSGGERQRVSIGRALLTAPRVLLLDEPLTALDGPRKDEILHYLERLRDETRIPIVLVSHSIDEVTRLADWMAVFNEGRLAAFGSVFDITARIDLFPMTGRFEAGVVLAATVAGHDRAHALTRLSFDGGELVVPGLDAPVGAVMRVRLRARDIMLALDPPERISANNVIAATIVEMRVDPGAFVEVLLQAGESRLIARITRYSMDRLGLEPGRQVHAILKTVTVERRSLAAGGEAQDL